jgi:two-component system, NtrC family, sensor kinase
MNIEFMSLSIPQFLICLVLSQQFLKFSRVNNLPRWEKLFRYAFIFTFFLIIAEASLSATATVKWIWYAFLIVLISYPFREKVFRPMHNYIMAFVPYVGISLVSDLTNLFFPDFFHGWINYFSTARLLALIWLVAIFFSQSRQRKAAEKERIRRQKEDEMNRAIAIRKVELEGLVAERTAELTKQKEQLEFTLAELTATQSQLIYSEKMASLGELTAGVAHEMQNPLNFVNNFSEVSIELLDEMKNELENGNKENVLAVADEIKQNLEKIRHHGKSADAVVKGMLLHSRKNVGAKELTDINALADEYLRLSYFSLRAKDKSFHATLKTDFDPTLSSDSSGKGKINVFPQELGRVILNLINNAFYAIREKKKLNIPEYMPTVSVTTKRINNEVEIIVRDNGTGIPSGALSKIFQPFFTTKPTGEGTGLGLSLSYDIVTKVHGGELTVETEEGEFTVMTVRIPV